MNKLFQSLLLGSAIALASLGGAHAADRNRNDSVLGVDVDVGLGGKKGLKADVDATIGGKTGVDADVDVSLGGKKGVNADVNATIGGDDGVDADVTAGIGKDVNVDIDLGTGIDESNAVAANPPAVDPGKDPDDGTKLTTAQRQAFNSLSDSEKAALVKRCGSVSSSGYDPALVQLCKLLRMSASR